MASSRGLNRDDGEPWPRWRRASKPGPRRGNVSVAVRSSNHYRDAILLPVRDSGGRNAASPCWRPRTPTWAHRYEMAMLVTRVGKFVASPSRIADQSTGEK